MSTITIFISRGSHGPSLIFDRLGDDRGLAVQVGLATVVLDTLEVVRLEIALHDWLANHASRTGELEAPNGKKK